MTRQPFSGRRGASRLGPRRRAAACRPCTDALCATAEETAQRLFRNRVDRIGQSAVALDDFPAQRREARPAALATACRRFEQGLAEAFVQIAEEEPRLPVADAHDTRCGADRALLLQQFEQSDLAGADRVATGQIDTKTHQGHGGCDEGTADEESGHNKINPVSRADSRARLEPGLSARAAPQASDCTPSFTPRITMNLAPLSLLLALGALTATANAECNRPAAPGEPPDGAAAPRENRESACCLPQKPTP